MRFLISLPVPGSQKAFPAHPWHPTANREGFPDPHPFKKKSQGCVLCPFCNNLTHCHFDHQVDKNIGLFAKTNIATCETLQVIPPFTFFWHFWCRFLVLWTEPNKHTNMSHTGFRSNLIIFNAVQFFGFHHKISILHLFIHLIGHDKSYHHLQAPPQPVVGGVEWKRCGQEWDFKSDLMLFGPILLNEIRLFRSSGNFPREMTFWVIAAAVDIGRS